MSLPRSFYNRPTLTIARDLLGARLVRIDKNNRIAGIIIETEAYCGEEDLGCHAKAGLTKRNRALYGSPGHAYVYFTYGMHWMFNCVTRPEGTPEAVLIRGITATEGIDIIRQRRGNQPKNRWTDGPGKLTQALGIDGKHNMLDLTSADATIFVEKGIEIPNQNVTTSPRIGLNSVPEPWKSKPWRFLANLKEIKFN